VAAAETRRNPPMITESLVRYDTRNSR
jgi:hypothetical protein